MESNTASRRAGDLERRLAEPTDVPDDDQEREQSYRWDARETKRIRVAGNLPTSADDWVSAIRYGYPVERRRWDRHERRSA